jgi:hypothetical protein
LGGGKRLNDQPTLTIGGIIGFAFLLWSFGINGSPQTRKMINMFLFVLLVSIVMIRWNIISPFFIKNGPTKSGLAPVTNAPANGSSDGGGTGRT